MEENNEIIIMKKKELRKYEVIKKLIDKEINGTEAAGQLNMTVRWIKKMKARVIKEGARGIIHRSRGQTGNRALPQKKVKNIKALICQKYIDFGPTFAAEKLAENHRLIINKESLRQLMIEWGVWKQKPRKENKQYRIWRPRKDHYGEMEQFDGCYHQWFEKRASECCLLAAIDDATSQPTKLWFDTSEGVGPVFSFWDAYIREKGAPKYIYLDKYSTYKINHKAAEDNQNLITQFQRATRELGIELITAHSPEAKGRIERLFETLQDRLVKELRLNNISTMKEANQFLEEKFLPDFIKKFAVRAKQEGDLHRQIIPQERDNLAAIFSVQNTRVVGNDFTIRFKNQWLQLEKEQPVLVRKKETVLIEERLDNSLWIRLRNRYLDFRVLPERPMRTCLEKLPALPARKKSDWRPAANHPWRANFQNNLKVEKIKTSIHNLA